MKKSILACLMGLLFASCAHQASTAQNPTCSPPPKEGSQVVGQQTRMVKVCRDVVVQETWVKHTKILSPRTSSARSSVASHSSTPAKKPAPAAPAAAPPACAPPEKVVAASKPACKPAPPSAGDGSVANSKNVIINSPGASISDKPKEEVKPTAVVVEEQKEVDPPDEPEKMGTTVFEAPWAK